MKIDRSDFLKDDKFYGYLEFCNFFSFACPSGLIDPSEVEDGIGLLWVASTGSRLFTKRKPKRREVTIPE